jgi:hypothetical protein
MGEKINKDWGGVRFLMTARRRITINVERKDVAVAFPGPIDVSDIHWRGDRCSQNLASFEGETVEIEG